MEIILLLMSHIKYLKLLLKINFRKMTNVKDSLIFQNIILVLYVIFMSFLSLSVKEEISIYFAYLFMLIINGKMTFVYVPIIFFIFQVFCKVKNIGMFNKSFCYIFFNMIVMLIISYISFYLIIMLFFYRG